MGSQYDISPEGFHLDEDINSELLRGQLEEGFGPRIYNPLQDLSATDRLSQQRDAWAQEPNTSVVFTSGVFDVFHGNHRVYLLATKLNAVPHHYRRFDETSGEPWEALSPEERKRYFDYAIGDRVIKQIVSVDGDAGVALRKSHDPTKANMLRPIYGWDSRARDVLSASTTRGFETFPLADAATIHDPVQPELSGTPHAGILEIGRFVRPNTWAIYHESIDIIEGLQATTDPDELAEMHPTIVRNSDGLYSDEMLGGPFSTTALARRIGGSMTYLQAS